MINKLLADWEKVVQKNNPALADLFTLDGAFPGYASAFPKILFIGRESRFAPTGDRISSDLVWFKTLSSDDGLGSYWRRIISMVYMIQAGGKCAPEQLPDARDILAQMKATDNYGFAIMNISKYLNTADDSGTSNFTLINQFLKDSELDKRNFIREEIELLEPDIIITANLWDCGIKRKYIDMIFPPRDMSAPVCDSKNKVCLQNFRLNGRTIKRLDTYHFSCPGNDQELFYDPTMEVLF